MSYGGHEETFVEQVLDQCICSICDLPLRDAVQTDECGHRFCSTCFDCHQKNQTEREIEVTCPVCRTECNKTFNDKAIRRTILSMKVFCQNHLKDCEWTGDLCYLESHLKDECPFSFVSCIHDGCSMEMERNKLASHIEECSWKEVQCELCEEKYIQLKKEQHDAICEMVEVGCKNKCSYKALRKEDESMRRHIDDDCLLEIVSCPYSHIECGIKMPRNMTSSHVKSEESSHLSLSINKLRHLEDENEVVKKKISALEECIFEMQVETTISCDERYEFLWRIKDVKNEILTAKKSPVYHEIWSRRFTVFRHYTFRLNAYLDGCGDAKGKSLSIYLHSLSNEFDYVLTWALTLECHFILLHKENSYKGVFTHSFRNEEEDWGWRNFISLNELDKYIQDDSLFIKCIINAKK